MPVQPDNIPVYECRPSPAARPVLDVHVELLARSIKDVGLIQPIIVRQAGDGFEVIAGMHRLTAFKRLGRDVIPAIIRTDDDLHAELALIDENLIRNELSPAQRALAIARRKAIYEALHPSTAHGGDRKSSRQVGDLIEPEKRPDDAERFTKATADSTGSSERKIQRDAQRGELGEDVLAKVTNTSLDKGEELDALAKLSPEKRDELVDKAARGEKVSARPEVKKEMRNEREVELAAKQRDLPNERVGLIYCDIPRHFHVRSDETGLDRSPENHYPTMTFQQLLDLDVPSIAADDCILIFWSTAASLIDDIEIMAEWGFVTLRPREAGKLRRDFLVDDQWCVADDPPGGSQAYRSMQVWDKVRIGLGYWFRDRHEFILIGVRGSPVPPAPGTQDHSLFSEAKGEHSAKPDRVAEMIERLWPNIPKLEMFARKPRDPKKNWRVWGNQAPEPMSINSTNLVVEKIDTAPGAEEPPANIPAESSNLLPKSDIASTSAPSETAPGAVDIGKRPAPEPAADLLMDAPAAGSLLREDAQAFDDFEPIPAFLRVRPDGSRDKSAPIVPVNVASLRPAQSAEAGESG